ncbi:hypothetical protein PIB30_088731 [Stylosanthes scabra]|uniref:Uncharacterized protein n=1 Tax=Stylosanthes scabra TaxID=79078 RepID=A0ABU6WXE2_9FABA|nr:hypothetical protein [Stylosanthes scabra]
MAATKGIQTSKLIKVLNQNHSMKLMDQQGSNLLWKLQINIPFAKALEQMASYAKFMKDLISKKRNWKEEETIQLGKMKKESLWSKEQSFEAFLPRIPRIRVEAGA